MLLGDLGVHKESHLDGGGRTTQAYRRNGEYRVGGKEFQQSLKDELVKLFKKKMDVFEWSHEDILGIDGQVIEHSPNVDLMKKPVQQKRQVFAQERNKVVMEEVEKLLTIGFIQEVYYPEWLANVVMVKKSTGKWRICVDFTDLNNVCPKDSFPLPRID